MKANELMIGDWVRDNLTQIPLQVNASCIRQFERQEEQGENMSASPIPLTYEMLKANRHKCMGISKFGFPNIVIDTPKCYILKEFSYVHELQNALRLSGLTDLADNFKVNK